MALMDWLGRCPLVAILRGVTPDVVVEIGAALEAAGVVIVEVALNSPEPVESIRRLKEKFADRLLVGAGTVMTVAQVEAVAKVGGRLIVTPHAAVEVVRAAKRHGLIAAPGFFTPTEAFALLEAGADGLKLFPAEASSPRALQAIRAVLPPHCPVLPVGGIDAGNMKPWFDAGAVGFGVGGAIYRRGDTAETVAAKAAELQAGMRAAMMSSRESASVEVQTADEGEML
jgi:2-dehydro-3-deoxyphosphogalactonate aldolase